MVKMIAPAAGNFGKKTNNRQAKARTDSNIW